MYEVTIYVLHSEEYASVFFPSFYPDHVQDLLLLDPVPPSTHRFNRDYVLRQKIAGSTRLSTLNRVLEAETGIPCSIQNHFGIWEYEGSIEPWGEGRERETVTLDDVWVAEGDGHEEGRVFVAMVTTAFRLQEIFQLEERLDGLVSKVTSWRHHVAALRYLRNARDKTPEGQKKQDVDEKIKEYEDRERRSSNEVRSMFGDWDQLTGGVERTKSRYADDQSWEAREQEIEARFGQFWKEKKDFLDRSSWKQKKADGMNDSVINQPSGTQDQDRSQLGRYIAKMPKPMESRFAFSFVEAKEKIVTETLRSDSGQLSLDSDGFTLRSGVLLWGQLHTVFAGSLQREFQNNTATIPDMLPDGTIMQYIYKYRSAARNGKWKVRKAFGMPNPGNEGAPTEHFGWVVFHEDVHPVEVLNRCSRITSFGGISNRNTHIDKDVLYVGRYDWSGHCDPGRADESFDPLYRAFIRDSTGARLVDTEGLEEYDIERVEQIGLSTRRHGFMLAMDADRFSPDFLKPFLQECPNRGGPERIFRQAESSDGFGAFVSMPKTEYEFAWLLFSGKKHETFGEADELVAIVYDGLYRGLEGHTFAVENDPVQ
ncbi:hypothetical protein MMC07_003158 [Pseudocyphellaria aurata]|nr:hypothetical protein [Pseudocyphellaria aurata]